MLSDTIPASGDLSTVNSKVPSPKAEKIPEEDADELEEEDDDDEDELDEEYDSDGELVKPVTKEKAPAKDAKKSVRRSKHKTKKEEIEKSKNVDSIKRFSYLIGQTDLFKHFIDRRVSLLVVSSLYTF